MRRWRLPLIIGIPLLLALITAGIILLPRLTPSPTKPEVPVVRVMHLSAQDVTRLEKALNSPDMHVQATVMVPELASIYLAKGQPAYPAGSTVKVLQNTSVCKDSICQVQSVVTEPGGKQQTFLLYLTNVTGKWLVFATNIGKG